MLSNPQLLEFLKDLGTYAQESSKEIYLVGGCVRDFLFAKKHNQEADFDPRDIDIVVNTNAIKFIQHYKEALDRIGKLNGFDTVEILEPFEAFGTVKVQLNGYSDYDIELASTRSERYNKPAVFPKVKLIDSIKEDLPRRDFTINALLESLMPGNFGEIVDLVPGSGVKDFESGLVRVFHDESFIDDPTRIFRAARFMAKFDFEIEQHTLDLMKQSCEHEDFAKWYKKRRSRFQIEFDFIKDLEEAKSKRAIEFLKSVLKVDLPE